MSTEEQLQTDHNLAQRMQVEWSHQQLDVLRKRFPKHPDAEARMKDIRNVFVGDRQDDIPFALPVEDKRKIEQPNQPARQVKKPRMFPLPNNESELVTLPLVLHKPATHRNGKKLAWEAFDAHNHNGCKLHQQVVEWATKAEGCTAADIRSPRRALSAWAKLFRLTYSITEGT
jgi:hypothetical protein